MFSLLNKKAWRSVSVPGLVAWWDAVRTADAIFRCGKLHQHAIPAYPN